MFPTVSDCFHFSERLIGPIPCMEGWSSANPCKPWRWSFSVWPLCAYTAPNVASWPWYPIISPKNPKIPGACEIWYNYIYIYIFQWGHFNLLVSESVEKPILHCGADSDLTSRDVPRCAMVKPESFRMVPPGDVCWFIRPMNPNKLGLW